MLKREGGLMAQIGEILEKKKATKVTPRLLIKKGSGSETARKRQAFK